MAGMSHAGIVRVEHAALAIGTVLVAALIPLWFITSDAQAAGSASGSAANAVAGARDSAAPSAFEAAGVELSGGEDASAGGSRAAANATDTGRAAPATPAPIAVAVAPAERIAPRALSKLAEPVGPEAFSEVAPSVEAAPSTPTAQAPAEPPVDLSHTPSGWYTPVARYYFSARFGVSGPWSSGHHTGLDFVTKEGTPIRAATDGVVVAAASAGAYGQLLQIRIAPTTEIWMAHLDKFLVKKGDVVKAGQVVGKVGMTGNTTGPHCHFEVRVKDKPKNPEPYFWPDGKSVTKIGPRPE